MATALDIIKGSLRLINVLAQGDTPSDDEADEALQAMNYIIESCNNQRLMLYSINNVVGTLTANKLPHTVGTGGDINIIRPLRIEKAFVRIPNLTSPIDYALTQDDNNRYQEYSVKKIGVTYPTNFYYEKTFPLASIFTYPIQTMDLEIHMSGWAQLTQLAALVTDMAFPMGYENYLKYQLAVDLAPTYGKPLNRGDAVFDRCAELKREIKSVNNPDYQAEYDNALIGNRGSRNFNILRGF